MRKLLVLLLIVGMFLPLGIASGATFPCRNPLQPVVAFQNPDQGTITPLPRGGDDTLERPASQTTGPGQMASFDPGTTLASALRPVLRHGGGGTWYASHHGPTIPHWRMAPVHLPRGDG